MFYVLGVWFTLAWIALNGFVAYGLYCSGSIGGIVFVGIVLFAINLVILINLSEAL